MEKKCSTCQKFKGKEDFYKCFSKWDGLQTSCKQCQLEMSRLPHNRFKSYKSKLKREYNLDLDEYFEMHNKQNSLCALCEEEKPLQVDHCHTTGIVRGLLCRDCNVAIGFMKDSPHLLRKAANYVEKQ